MTSTFDIDSERHGALLRDAIIGQEVTFVVRGRVTKLEADMIDVSGYERTDALHGRVVTTVLVTEITRAPAPLPEPSFRIANVQ